MSDQYDNEPEIRRAPPRARQTRAVKKKAKPQRRAAPEQEARSEAPLRREAPRPAPPRAEGTRETNREPARRGAVVVMSRTGEVLTRHHNAVSDPFDVPMHEIPAGWTYQWNAVTILNRGIEEIVQGDLHMHRNGWRPVPATRHPGRWTHPGFEGQIVVDGQRLEERPESLTAEAKAEDILRAKSQVRDRTDALRLTQKALPGANVAAQRNQAGGMRMAIDPGLDIPRGADYDLADE